MTSAAGMMGDGAGDEPAEPGFEPNVEKSFHDDLASQRAGERGVLAGGKHAQAKSVLARLAPRTGLRSL